MNPLANELCRVPMRRCLDRTHHYAKHDGHYEPSGYLIGHLSGIRRIKDGVSNGVEGKVPEWGEPNFPEAEGEDEDLWEDEDEK